MSCVRQRIAIFAAAIVLSLLVTYKKSGATANNFEARTASAWLAFGDLRGFIEPCGCNPKTDLGGIRRLGTFVAQARRAHAELSLYDLGNNVPVEFAAEKTKVTFILEGIAALKPTASLFNELELRHHQAVLQIGAPHRLPYVLSNARREFPGVERFVATNQEVVFGVVAPETPDQKSYIIDINGDLKTFIAEVRAANPTKNAVLLYAGSDAGLSRLLASNSFDRVVLSNHYSFEATVDHRERSKPELLLRRVKGQPHLMVPVGGQGILRGGVLRQRQPLALKDVLQASGTGLDCLPSQPSCKFPQKSSDLVSPRDQELVTWLERSFEKAHPFAQLFKRYNAATTALFEAQIASRLSGLEDTHYVGAQACASCHPEAYETWKNSGHAKAWSTLVTAAKDSDHYCVACHVVGYENSGGFVSFKHSPQLANVQCENCHGPRKQHVLNPAMARATSNEVYGSQQCVDCHHGTHSPEFHFETYWQKISHGMP